MDHSLKILIPCGEYLFPTKELFKVWELGKGNFCRGFLFFSCVFCLRNFYCFVKIKETSYSLKRTEFY